MLTTRRITLIIIILTSGLASLFIFNQQVSANPEGLSQRITHSSTPASWVNESRQPEVIKSIAIAGRFTAVDAGGDNTIANRAARWQPETMTWSVFKNDFDAGVGFNNDVLALAYYQDSVFFGGVFDVVDYGGSDLQVNHVVRWDLSTNTWHALEDGTPEGNGVNDTVWSMIVIGDQLYLGGSFTQADQGGTPISANRIVRWDITNESWHPLENASPGGNGASSNVTALCSIDEVLYIGGMFTSVDKDGEGISANAVVGWNPNTQTWLPLEDGGSGNGIGSGVVYACAVLGNDLYLGGNFQSYDNGGTNMFVSRVVRWNTVTNTWHPLEDTTPGGNGVNGGILSLAALDGDLYLGGSFWELDYAGVVIGTNNIARWDPDSTTWDTLGTGVNGRVRTLSQVGDDLYVGGEFNLADPTGTPILVNRVARWDPVTATWHALKDNDETGAGTNSDVYAIAYIPGEVPAMPIARPNTYTTPKDAPVNGNLITDDTGQGVDTYAGLASMVVDDPPALGSLSQNANGNFTFDPAGHFDDLYDGMTKQVVFEYTLTDETTFSSSALVTITVEGSGQPVPPVARPNEYTVDADETLNGNVISDNTGAGVDSGSGQLTAAVHTPPTTGTLALAPDGGFTYDPQGAFDHLLSGTSTQVSFAYLLQDATLLTDTAAVTITVQGVKVLVEPDHTLFLGGTPPNAFTWWDIQNSLWMTITGAVNGNIFALSEHNGDIYVGGYFATVHDGSQDITVNHLARYNLKTSTWHALKNASTGGTGTNDIVRGMAWVNDQLFIGGEFDEVDVGPGGDYLTVKHIARWDSTNETWHHLDDDTPGGIGLNGDVYTLLAHGNDLYLGGLFTLADHFGSNIEVNHVARWDTLSKTWHPLAVGAGVDGEVWALSLVADDLYIGGKFGFCFTALGNVASHSVVRWNLTDKECHPLEDGGNGDGVQKGASMGTVYTFAQYGDLLYIGGDYNMVDAYGAQKVANNITAWDMITNRWDPLENGGFGTGVDYPVFALVMVEDMLYLGGAFTKLDYGGDDLVGYGFAGWDPVEEEWKAYATKPGFSVNTILHYDLSGHQIYLPLIMR